MRISVNYEIPNKCMVAITTGFPSKVYKCITIDTGHTGCDDSVLSFFESCCVVCFEFQCMLGILGLNMAAKCELACVSKRHNAYYNFGNAWDGTPCGDVTADIQKLCADGVCQVREIGQRKQYFEELCIVDFLFRRTSTDIGMGLKVVYCVVVVRV